MSSVQAPVRRPVPMARTPSHAEIPKTPARPLPASPEAALAQQRSGGNQSLKVSGAAGPRYALDADTKAAIKADIETIVPMMQRQALWASGEREIVDLIRAWAMRDRAITPAAGTPHIDEFLRQTKQRVYKRSTGRSGFMEQYARLYEDLFLELEDERRTEFEALVSSSREYSGPPGAQDLPENFWSTMGKKEAVGVWGILKGMGTSAAGMVDAGAWAITYAMRKAGIPAADPIAAADWLAKQYDISGDAMFGDEWSHGEELFAGMSAAEFSTHGGEIVWQLVMIGRGGGTGWAQTVERVLGLSSNLMAVDDSARRIAAIIERMQKQSPSSEIDVKVLLQDPEFYREVTRLVANVFGAAAGGNQNAKRIAVLLESAQVAPIIGQIIVIQTSDASAAEKAKKTGPVMMELLKQLVSVGGAAYNPQGAGAAPGMEGAGGGKSRPRTPDKSRSEPAKKADTAPQKPAPQADVVKPPAPQAEMVKQPTATPAQEATPKVAAPQVIKDAPEPVKQLAKQAESAPAKAPKDTPAKKKAPGKKAAPGKQAASAKKEKKEAPKPQKEPPKQAAAGKKKAAPAAPAKGAAGGKPAKAAKAPPASAKKKAAPQKKADAKGKKKAQKAAQSKKKAPTAAQLAARAYLDDLRKKPPKSGSAGEGWDYKRFPGGTGERWKPGDPPDMPGRKGHPSWDTVRERVWKNLAHNELEARKAGLSERDTTRLLDMDPVKSLTNAELEAILKSGSGRKDFEIEHKGIPQRVITLLESIGIPSSEARQLAHQGDPANLDAVPKEWHAIVDAIAADFTDRNPTLPAALDDRKQHPLRSASDQHIQDMLDEIAKRKIDLGATDAGRKLRDLLQQEKKDRNAKWVVP